MAVDIDLIRHAQSAANARKGYVGQADDEPVTLLGERQALLLRDRYRAERAMFDAVWTSTASRTQRTAHLGLRECGPAPEPPHPGLVEIGRGEWMGRRIEEVFTPDLVQRLRADDAFQYQFHPPGGESLAMVEQRMLRALYDDILPRHADGRIAIVSHGVAIRCLLRHCLGIDARWIYRMHIDNTGVSRLRYDAGTDMWELRCINDTGHLSAIDDHTSSND